MVLGQLEIHLIMPVHIGELVNTYFSQCENQVNYKTCTMANDKEFAVQKKKGLQKIVQYIQLKCIQLL